MSYHLITIRLVHQPLIAGGRGRRRGKTGTYRVVSSDGEKYRAFIPSPLPPDPPLRIERDLQYENDRALLSLGRLDMVTTLRPAPELFLYMYVRKEAVLS